MHLEISGDFFGPVGALELPGLLPPWTWGGFRFTRASNYLLLSLGFFQPAAHGGGLAKFRSEQLLCFSGISLMAAWINEAIFSIDPTQEANELPGGVKIPVGFSILKTWIIWDDPQVTTIYSRLNHQAEFGTELFLLRALCSSNRSHAGSKWTACLAKFRSVFLLCFSGISLMAAWPWKKVLDEAVALGVQGWCDKASKITVNLAIAWFTDVSSIKF